MRYEEIKKKYKLEEKDVAQIFSYKNANSFIRATRRPKIIKGIEELYRIFKSQ